jgi:hypothetical protein
MPPERRSATALERAHHLELAEADVTGVGLPPRGPMVAEGVRDLQSGTGHDPGRYVGARASWRSGAPGDRAGS